MIGYLIAGVTGGVAGAVLVVAVVWYASYRESKYLEEQAKDRA